MENPTLDLLIFLCWGPKRSPVFWSLPGPAAQSASAHSALLSNPALVPTQHTFLTETVLFTYLGVYLLGWVNELPVWSMHTALCSLPGSGAWERRELDDGPFVLGQFIFPSNLGPAIWLSARLVLPSYPQSITAIQCSHTARQPEPHNHTLSSLITTKCNQSIKY